MAASARAFALCVSAAASSLCTACGATGLDWVSEAHSASASAQRVNEAPPFSVAPASATTAIPATAEQSPTDSRPRLNHTVTLGEIDAPPASAPADRSSGPALIVNNYNQVNVMTPTFGYGGYGGYGYSRIPAGFSPGHVTPYPTHSAASSGPLPGQNWPAIADHGPSFPYQALPASPWTRTR